MFTCTLGITFKNIRVPLRQGLGGLGRWHGNRHSSKDCCNINPTEVGCRFKHLFLFTYRMLASFTGFQSAETGAAFLHRHETTHFQKEIDQLKK